MVTVIDLPDDLATFPLDVWGEVRGTGAAGAIEKIKVVESPGGGYLVLTVQNGSEYDTWVQTLEEVETDLRMLDVDWASAPPGPNATSSRRSDQPPRR